MKIKTTDTRLSSRCTNLDFLQLDSMTEKENEEFA